jgi:hypothetical protein
MSKKNYVAVARLIHELNAPIDVKYELIDKMCEIFAADNPRFNRCRFVNACTGVC